MVRSDIQPLAAGWRIVGQWEDGREFLVVLGRTREMAQFLLDQALEEYTIDNLRKISSLWLERWDDEQPQWERIDDVPLRPVRARRVAAGKTRK